jgi:hypothetical protein
MYWLAILQLKGMPDVALSLLQRASSLGHLASSRKLALIFLGGRLGIGKFFGGIALFIWACINLLRFAMRDINDERLDDLPQIEEIRLERRIRWPQFT